MKEVLDNLIGGLICIVLGIWAWFCCLLSSRADKFKEEQLKDIEEKEKHKR